jgi:carbohydrate-selective porin OprB
VGRRNLFPLAGHYRLWARVSGTEEDRDRISWATGVSFDQLITRNLGVFLRAAVSRTEDEPLTSHAWSVGVQLTPAWMGRPDDAVGVGYGEQREPEGRERVVEVYYRLQLAEWFAFIPNVQWLPTGVNTLRGTTTRNVVVPGLRAVLTF